jgi:hypothetical protein
MNIGSRILTSAALLAVTLFPAAAQDDLTTRNAGSAFGGGYITGPASSPLSFLSGSQYGTLAVNTPYLIPDFRPVSKLDAELPSWISFGMEDRFRYEGYHNSGFKLNNNDSYLLLRTRVQMTLRFGQWFKVVSQVQDARPFLQKAPYGPPNENRWDLKLAYAEVGDPEHSWFNVRLGRQLLNYNNTLIANSE